MDYLKQAAMNALVRMDRPLPIWCGVMGKSCIMEGRWRYPSGLSIAWTYTWHYNLHTADADYDVIEYFLEEGRWVL